MKNFIVVKSIWFTIFISQNVGRRHNSRNSNKNMIKRKWRIRGEIRQTSCGQLEIIFHFHRLVLREWMETFDKSWWNEFPSIDLNLRLVSALRDRSCHRAATRVDMNVTARTLECWPSVDYLIVASELQNKVTIFLHRKRAKQDVELEHYNDCGNRLNSQLLNIQLLPITVFISFFHYPPFRTPEKVN